MLGAARGCLYPGLPNLPLTRSGTRVSLCKRPPPPLDPCKQKPAGVVAPVPLERPGFEGHCLLYAYIIEAGLSEIRRKSLVANGFYIDGFAKRRSTCMS